MSNSIYSTKSKRGKNSSSIELATKADSTFSLSNTLADKELKNVSVDQNLIIEKS